MDSKTTELTLDVEQIKKLLPHRAPFLFVEKLTDIRPDESAVGYKAVSYNEPHFHGHFPEFAVMPGVLIVEAMAQTAGALVVHSLGTHGREPRCLFHDHRQGALPAAGQARRPSQDSGEGAAAARSRLEVRRPGICGRRIVR